MKLLFINGASTEADRSKAKDLGAVIRNAKAYHSNDSLEACSEVYGCYPEAYAEFAVEDDIFDRAAAFKTLKAAGIDLSDRTGSKKLKAELAKL